MIEDRPVLFTFSFVLLGLILAFWMLQRKQQIKMRFSDTSPIPYMIPYSLPLLQFLGVRYLGVDIGIWTSTFIAFVLIPLFDHVFSLDFTNPTREESRILDDQRSFRLVTWLWAPMQVTAVLNGALIATTRPLDGINYAVFVFTVGLGTGALGINIAHELIHKHNAFERFLGKLMLVFVCYGHFYVEHIEGHHKRVATEEDPATSSRGESFYRFWLRSVVGSFRSACEIEAKRLSNAPFWQQIVCNQIVHFCASSLAIAAYITNAYGVGGLRFFVLQSIVAFSLLEVVNYIEHYGLKREKKETGKFVAVTPAHSWNAAHRISNYFLFKLQRHSDHHANAGRRYQILRSFRNSPQMPSGYPLMMILALVPPVWYSIMDKRLDEYERKMIQLRSTNAPLCDEQM